MENRSLLERKNSLIDKDSSTVWHPYTQALTCEEPVPIQKAEGAILYTEDGREIIDAISSWWVTLHGHRNPHIVEKIKKQMNKIEHVMFADFTHSSAVELAGRLLQLLPEEFSRVFYSDNGSTAVETAIKIAFQYWYNNDSKTKRKKVIAFRGGYHGETFGAMSVSERGLFTGPFLHALFDVEYIDPPVPGKEDKSIEQLKSILSKGEIACFIFEPIVQSVAGMKVHSASGLDHLVRLCHDCEVITIADEVMTGFGRTGPNFAIERLKNIPDMICLSKGITGGFLPLGVTVCKERLYERFLSTERAKAFLHGHSYCGNPLACAAGIASLEILDTSECQKKRQEIQRQHEAFLVKWKAHPKIASAHVTGTILGIEYITDGNTSYYNAVRDGLFSHFRSRHILIRPLGNTIHILPPYCISEEQLSKVYDAIEETMENDLW